MKKTMKTKVIAGILSAITVFSASSIAMTTASAAVIPTATTGNNNPFSGLVTEEEKAAANSINDMKISCAALNEELSGMDGVLYGVYMAVNSMIDALDKKTTLDDVINKIDNVRGDIAQSRNDLYNAMENVSDMAEFTKLYNTVHEQIDDLKASVKNIRKFGTAQEQNEAITRYIGRPEVWSQTNNHLIFNFVSFGKYLAGEKKLLSNNKTIFDTIFNHYSKQSVLGTEAHKKTARLVADSLLLYTQGAALLTQCINAEKELLKSENSATNIAYIYNCCRKIKEIANLGVSAKKTYSDFKANNTPYQFFDRSNATAPQRNIVIQKSLGQVSQGNINDSLMSTINGSNVLDKAQMEYLIQYVKNQYPGKSLAEFFRENGLECGSGKLFVSDAGHNTTTTPGGSTRTEYHYNIIDLNDKNPSVSGNTTLYYSISRWLWINDTKNYADADINFLRAA